MTPHDLPGISVVIPVYNEADNVGALGEEIYNALNGKITFEAIFVDDESKDSTPEALAALCAKYECIHSVRHLKNAGQSAAVLTGVKTARYPWIATLDGDGQNNPADIPNLIDTLILNTHAGQANNAILVAGQRTQRQDTLIRKLSSKVANKIRTAFLKDDCPDSGCGIKLFNRKLFLELPHFKHCHRFLPALFRRAGASIYNVPVSHRERQFGQSKYGISNRLWVGIIDLIGVAWLMRRSITVEPQHVSSSLQQD